MNNAALLDPVKVTRTHTLLQSHENIMEVHSRQDKQAQNPYRLVETISQKSRLGYINDVKYPYTARFQHTCWHSCKCVFVSFLIGLAGQRKGTDCDVTGETMSL